MREGTPSAAGIGCALLLLLGLCAQQPIAAAKKSNASAPPSKAAHRAEAASILVATDAGVIPMSQKDYGEYVKSMGHLPVMSKDYVFGHTIPQPHTDKFGHIHLSAPPAASGGDGRE